MLPLAGGGGGGGQIESSEVLCLMDPGSQVSLINADMVEISQLRIEPTPVRPVAINQQPISITGSATCRVTLGPLQTSWQFLVVRGIASAVVMGVDFIRAHHQRCWGVRDGMWCFDDVKIPIWREEQVREQTVRANDVLAQVPVVSCCTVELEPRQQTIISMRTEDRSQGPTMMFEAQRLPQGVLLSKTLVEPGLHGEFNVRAVNYSAERITMFKNQKFGVVEPIEEFVELPTLAEDYQGSSIVDLGLSDTNEEQRCELAKLIREYDDVFSTGKRDVGHYQGVQHHIQLKPDAVPVRQPVRRFPLAYQAPVKKQLKNMLDDGLIE